MVTLAARDIEEGKRARLTILPVTTVTDESIGNAGAVLSESR
jgi:hypothetical protein